MSCVDWFATQDATADSRQPTADSRQPTAVLALLLCVACTDAPEVPLTGPLISPRAIVVPNPELGTWNVFQADVDIAIDGSDVPGLDAQRPSRGVSYRITRRRGKVGEWITVQEFGDLLPKFQSSTPGLGVPAIARSIDLGDGSAIQFYDSRGSRAEVPKFEMPRLPVRGVQRGGVVNGALPRLPFREGSSETMIDSSSAWIERFIVTPEGAARVQTRLERNFGLPDRRTLGSLRFSKRVGASETEVTVNEVTGLIEKVRTFQSESPVAESTREYARDASGSYLLASERIISFDASGKRSRQTVMTRYRNIRIMEDK